MTWLRFSKSYNVTTTFKQFNGTAYGGSNTIYTATGGNTNTILIYNGGVGGTTLESDISELSTDEIPNSACDVIIIADGFNDPATGTSNTPSTFTSQYLVLISDIQSQCPGVPIICTTENQTPGNTALNLFNGMTTSFVGQNTPINPPYINTTNYGVTVLDTRQAWNNCTISVLMFDALHPKDQGYIVQSLWMLNQLAPTVLPAFGASTPSVMSSAAHCQRQPTTGTPP